jgi:hypothetical protein
MKDSIASSLILLKIKDQDLTRKGSKMDQVSTSKIDFNLAIEINSFARIPRVYIKLVMFF